MTLTEDRSGADGRPMDNPLLDQLLNRIEAGEAVVGVVGLGYVGLPLAYSFVTKGITVIGFDVDPSKVDDLEAGRSYLGHLGQGLFDTLRDAEHFSATIDSRRLTDVDAVIVAVPTPLGPHNEPDLSFVEETAGEIGLALRPGQLIVLESTTYPGTTRREFADAIANAHRANHHYEIGTDFFIGYSPEREDPGNALESRRIPKLVGGLEPASAEAATALYRVAFEEVIPVGSAEVAEAAKLLENIFRAVNIALVNEMKIVLNDMDIDIWDVIDAASSKPFGFMPFYPGPGLGGHCIPIDPFYLTWKAKEVNRPVQFIELAGLVNKRMPDYVVERLVWGLNEMSLSLNGSKVLVLGLAYKPDVSDARESPSFEIIELLAARGADVDYSDPHIPVAPITRRHNLETKSIELTHEAVEAYDAIVIATDHGDVDYELIAAKARIIVDTRNAMADHDVQGLLVRA